MKKVFQITMFLAIAAMAFVSCEKDDKKSDPRDQFVGSYTSITSGTITMTVDGEKISEDIDDADVFTIEKLGDADKVVITSGGESTECTVSGNNISCSEPYTESGNGIVLNGTATVNGAISGNTLTLTHKITGSVTGIISGTFSGNATEIATKK